METYPDQGRIGGDALEIGGILRNHKRRTISPEAGNTLGVSKVRISGTAWKVNWTG